MNYINCLHFTLMENDLTFVFVAFSNVTHSIELIKSFSSSNSLQLINLNCSMYCGQFIDDEL